MKLPLHWEIPLLYYHKLGALWVVFISFITVCFRYCFAGMYMIIWNSVNLPSLPMQRVNNSMNVCRHKCVNRHNDISPWYIDHPIIEDEEISSLKGNKNMTKKYKNCKYCKKVTKHKSYNCKNKTTFHHSIDTKNYIEEYKKFRSSTRTKQRFPQIVMDDHEEQAFKANLKENNVVLDLSIM